ncbi:MAG: IclR family transcriptional regulator [Ruminococcus flavefaciens]|nr:IclR family transcriptional regulator [Ruminococcus flavefaciens]
MLFLKKYFRIVERSDFVAEKKQSVQSVNRLLDILEVLSSVPQGMNLSDLAEATQLHISTTYRFVSVLADRGYVRKDSNSGKYRLTLRLFQISQRVSSVLELLPASEGYLEDLANFSREAVHLVERNGSEVVYLYKFEPFQHLVNMGTYVGCYNPMYCTGVGKSIMAYLSRKEVEIIWNDTDICQYTPKTITRLEDMYQELEQIRQRGFAYDNEEHEEGIRCIAAPIFNWENAPTGAVSISAPVSRMTDTATEMLAPKLLSVANEISCLLGRKPF